jgi:hypothetical protein
MELMMVQMMEMQMMLVGMPCILGIQSVSCLKLSHMGMVGRLLVLVVLERQMMVHWLMEHQLGMPSILGILSVSFRQQIHMGMVRRWLVLVVLERQMMVHQLEQRWMVRW